MILPLFRYLGPVILLSLFISTAAFGQNTLPSTVDAVEKTTVSVEPEPPQQKPSTILDKWLIKREAAVSNGAGRSTIRIRFGRVLTVTLPVR